MSLSAPHVDVQLGPVQETLLIPLYGRALESRSSQPLLHDPLAAKIVDRLDYDFAKWDKAPSLRGACIRTIMYDRLVKTWLTAHPSGTVVELGCGLNTRFDRVDNGSVRWFDLDLPDAMALRREFIEDAPRCEMIAASALDTDWHDQVAASPGPYLFISEAVLIYVDEDDVRRAITGLVERFRPATFILDTTNAQMVDTQDKHDAMKHLTQASYFRWKCDDPAVITEWARGMALTESQTFADAGDEVIATLPFAMRTMIRLFPNMMRKRVDGYRINVLTAR
ncbi:MAG: class I SAM-dependent methyltransferase [Pseudomonadota bacterium]